MNQEIENDVRLQETLRQWMVTTPLPPRFEQRVWRRIEQADAQRQPTTVESLVRLIELVLVRPKLAYAYAAVLLVLGMAAGSWAAQRETVRLSATLGSRYVQSIDPYYTAGPH